MSAETTDTDPTGDGDGDTGDGDGDTGDGDATTTSGECFAQPDICSQFVRCIAALVPGQLETVEAQYGEDGSCWCGTEAEAQGCFQTCFEQVETAIKNNPTVNACHDSFCTLEDLDPEQPYGPVENGSCAPYTGTNGQPVDQMPFTQPFGVPGSFCAPKCSGLANACPDSNQTSAQGTCYISSGPDSYCVSRCYVDPTVLGGTQCQCGATCQPQGSADGEGNLRGLCTFE